MMTNSKWVDANEFKRCVEAWAEKVGVQPRFITLRPMKRKWASCSIEGRLTFNTELLGESREFGEYVIVHELLHLRVPRHGKLFWSLLTAYLPDWGKVVTDQRRTGKYDDPQSR
ncbi:MAG: M48 family metallopeptidase [Candidatus Tectomicrobia bacterium]|nr:M48 family metallopeptidase [Candidatus Tectomicrobia bacterium]